MGRGKALTDFERGEIAAFHKSGCSQRDIAQKLNRSNRAIFNELHKDERSEKMKTGRKRKLSDRDERHIVLSASNKRTTSRRIKHDLGLQVSTRTIRRVLEKTEYLTYSKMRRGPWSDERVKKHRLEWAQHCEETDQEWNTVIFSDEKKFNLDGPDGFNYYWHDLRKDNIRFSKRHSGGGGIMFWGGIGALGSTPLVKVEGTLNSVKYQSILKDNLIPCTSRISGPKYRFQQDGASCHRSQATRSWLRRSNIDVLDWPPYSPDMNIIENLWGIMARKVYPDGKVYLSLDALEAACRNCWSEITQDYITSLFDSMPRRINELVQSKGGPTSY